MEEEEKEFDVKETIKTINDEISKNMDKKLSDFGANFNDTLEKKFDKLSANESNEQEFEEPEEDLGEVVTKADLKKFENKLVEKVLKKTTVGAEKIFESKTKKQLRDAEAFKTFPKLNRESREFDESFFNQVVAEMKRRAPNGPDDNPDLIYDSAAVVQADLIAKGKYVPKTFAEVDNQRRNNREDSFEIGSGGGGGKAPTQKQIEFAMQNGLTKESLTKYMKKYE